MKTLVIIPAAGLATRMQPLSATMSKAMIPVCGKPILARILKKLEKISCDIVIVGGDIPDIKNYIESRYHQNVFYTSQVLNNAFSLFFNNAFHFLIFP